MAVPLKPEYGPTLGRLLAPRWRAARPLVRGLVVAAMALVVLAAAGLALTLENAHYSHGGPVPFHFSYRDLARSPTPPGGYVEVAQRWHGGALRYSFAVYPLMLPPYSGEVGEELPLYAASFIATLRRSLPGFVLRGEGKTKVSSNTAPGYEILYTAQVEGREMYGRDVLLLPERPGERAGVKIVMLTALDATRQVQAPNEVGTSGVVLLPLKSFSFG